MLLDLRVFMVLSLFALFYNWKLESKPIYKMMRQSSILIFTLHFLFIGIFRMVCPTVEILQRKYSVNAVLCA